MKYAPNEAQYIFTEFLNSADKIQCINDPMLFGRKLEAGPF